MTQGIIRNQIKDLNTTTFDAIYMYIYLEVVALKIDDDIVWYKLVTNWCVNCEIKTCQIKEREKVLRAQQEQWDEQNHGHNMPPPPPPQQHQIQHPYMLSHQPSPFLNMG